MQNEQTGELNAQIFVNSTAETVQNSESNVVKLQVLHKNQF